MSLKLIFFSALIFCAASSPIRQDEKDQDLCGSQNSTCLGCLDIPQCIYVYINDGEGACISPSVNLHVDGSLRFAKTEEQCSPISKRKEIISPETRVANDDDKTTTTEPDPAPTMTPVPSSSSSTSKTTQTTSIPTTTITSSSSSSSSTEPSKTTTTSIPTIVTTTLTPDKTTTTPTASSSTTTSVTPSPPPTTSPTTGSTTTSATDKPTSTRPSTSTTEPPKPSGRSHFDGWSFFGGILLTMGFFAIGFVGLKYYRVRTGQDGNYNRF